MRLPVSEARGPIKSVLAKGLSGCSIPVSGPTGRRARRERASLPPPVKTGARLAPDLPETVAELVGGTTHQTDIRVMLKSRVRHLRSVKRLLGFVLSF